MTQIQLVALDVAGTTVEEHGAVYAALHEAVREAGSTATAADVEHWMGAEKRAAIVGLLATGGVLDAPDTVVDAAFARFGELLAQAYAATPPVALPGVEAAIAALRTAGVKVALTTGFSRDVVDAILTTLGWTVAATPAQQLDAAVTLDAVVAASEVGAGRPAPYMVHRAMEATGVLDVAAVATAGDTVRDLQAGTNAGAGMVLGVLTGQLGTTDEGRAALAAQPHTALLGSVADLPAHLGL